MHNLLHLREMLTQTYPNIAHVKSININASHLVETSLSNETHSSNQNSHLLFSLCTLHTLLRSGSIINAGSQKIPDATQPSSSFQNQQSNWCNTFTSFSLFLSPKGITSKLQLNKTLFHCRIVFHVLLHRK